MLIYQREKEDFRFVLIFPELTKLSPFHNRFHPEEYPMQNRRCALCIAAVLVALVLTCSAFVAAQTGPADRITTAIVASQRTAINGVHPLATKQNDLGRVNGSQVFHRMVLVLQRSAAQEADLQQLLKEQQDPTSAQYHKWLTPIEFGQRFGPSDDDMATIVGWLKSQGFSVEPASHGRQFLVFTGTSAQVESAFQTQMHLYGVGGKTYIANAQAASIPTALAPDVRGVASLNSFDNEKLQPTYHLAPNPKIAVATGLFTGPTDLSNIYNAAPLQKAGIEGQGESIALIEESDINPQDLTDFRTLTGLPAATLNVIQNGPDPGLLAGDGEEFEAIADVEYAGAMAPDATLNVIVSASTEFIQGIDLSQMYAVDYAVSPITSMSYGGCETLNDTYYNDATYLFGLIYEQGAAEGMSQFVSAGDNGGDACGSTGLSAGYGVNSIGDSPWNVSVGGTEFIMPDPSVYFPAPKYTATGYIPESTWNDYENPYDGRPLAGGGGVSIDWSKPDWQAGTGVPADGQRDVPDVALLAGDNLAYLTCESDLGYDCAAGYGGGVIGTSLAAPNWAAIQALVDQKNNLIGGAGNPNPTYYKLAASSSSPFHDITTGDTKVPDPNGELVGYTATTGYDLATGLGSVDVNKLATNWMSSTGSGTATVTLTTGGTSITHGDTLNTNVTVSSGGSTIPTGDVAMVAGTEGVYQLTLDNTGATSLAFGSSSGVELPGGSYNLTAHYAGDTNFAPATSNAVALTVNPEPTVTQAGSNAAGTVLYGTPVTLAAAAYGVNSGSGYPVPGTYTFTDTSTSTALGSASIAQTGESFAYLTTNSAAYLSLSGAQSLGAGTHQITVASPASGASFLTSTSNPVTVVVQQSSVLVSLTPDHTTPALNSTVNLNASVINLNGQNVPVTGRVDFYDASTNPQTLLGSATLPASADYMGAYDVSLPVTFTTAGLHTVYVYYNGDSNDYGNISGAANITVGGKASTSTTIGGQTFGLANNSVTIIANVAGDTNGTVPTGTVTFIDTAANSGAGATVGTAPVSNNGSATLITKALTAGQHLIIASYSGDGNFAASSSQSIAVLVGDFTFAAGSSSASVTAGQSTSSINLTYTGTMDFSSVLYGATISLSCSGLPAGATCNFTPAALSPTDNSNGTTSAAATVTITTVGPTLVKASLAAPRKPWGGEIPVTLAGLLALGLPLVRRRRKLFSALLGVIVLFAVTGLGGCSSGGQYNVTNPGTAAGTDSVIVTATLNGGAYYGTLTHSATIALTVTAAGQ